MSSAHKSSFSCEDLAIFGGRPKFSQPLHVNRPNAGNRATFDAYVDEIWRSRWFTNNGPLLTKLERDLESFLGVKHCVAMASGTLAFEVLLRAFDFKGELIVPAFTFVSTAHVARSIGLEPVFCDIDPDTWNLDLAACERLVTERTAAIVPTHLWGRPCDIDGFTDLAHRKGIRLVFDAAHAFGCTYGQNPIGGFGDAEVFSFQANKLFHCGEGGAVATNDDRLAEKLKSIRNFGFTDIDKVDQLGTNAKLSELAAALGLTNLDSYDQHVENARQTYQLYREQLDGVAGVSILPFDEVERNNYQYVVVSADPALALSRDDIVDILRAENILARRYFYPGCHRMEPHRSDHRVAANALPVTDRFAGCVIVMPAGADIALKDVADACMLLKCILRNADLIKKSINEAKRS